MSGGTFDHNDAHITMIANEVEQQIVENPQELTPETLKVFQAALNHLRKAAVLVHRIDWLLAGDDGEDTFQERLNDDLRQLKDWEKL